MAKADEIYNKIAQEIIENGYSDQGLNVRTVYADGEPAYTKSLFGVQVKFQDSEVPILTSKRVAWKTAIKEMMLFWIKQSVKKEDFQTQNVKVWDEWFLENNTLGKSYAYQFESRPKKKVVKVNRKTKFKHSDTFEHIKVAAPLECNTENTSKHIGKIYETKDYGRYKVIDVYKNNSNPNPRMLIQFLNTNYVKEVDAAQVIHKQNIPDHYCRFYFNVGYLGDADSVKYFDKETKNKHYRRWYYMLQRCYDESTKLYPNYGGKGVFVDERWHSFENYLRDLRLVPQFFLAQEENYKGWSLDKDYYGANYYGFDSAVWLRDGDNLSYRNTHNPFYLIKPDGSKELFLTYADAEKEYGLSNLCKLNSGRKHVRNHTIEIVDVTNSDELYRYSLSKNQVVELIHNIKNNPSSRRLMTSFWNYDDVEDKALQECAFQTQWAVENGKLHLILTQRSGDWGLGIPFNQFQYYVLLNLIAQVCNLEVGTFTHHIGSCHIYDRHINSLKEQINQQCYDAPILKINSEIKDFFDFTLEDIELLNYSHGKSVGMEVAI
jgi:thymidylate synthase